DGIAGRDAGESIDGRHTTTARALVDVVAGMAALLDLDHLSRERLDPDAMDVLVVGTADLFTRLDVHTFEVVGALVALRVLGRAAVVEDVRREPVDLVLALEHHVDALQVAVAKRVALRLDV